ncbi:MAG TPA: deoxyribonuclease IV [Candidatus Methanoculleus thermohydrogenotrophicum]|jgi:deoxyribonuclease-4|nr:deoxyribonuclease IV [Candidatus Methanoculleus thermohydrogenotrophicum]NLM82951.1 deoxyribonuclease IV [Candidatus Methanoculleus thermohydrogenotrophicum]HOB18126.1 deoxyribonuclease IV [Candidatus Methanoculleus thermohydrogenotrophicum]HPZ38261.1 deoxyribonuclease IV [Candidatus Methanoculleus thermohydrogenotrophicum]HQC91474.1 deoxyribonuclease IV [Candidatus Methanoculleus thermohydrogenotrophicum]
MVRVGCHVSIAGSIDLAVGRAGERGCDTFQIFSRNPRGWRAKDLDPRSVDAFRAAVDASGLGPVVDHMPYLPNLASPDDAIYEKSVVALTGELRRCGLLGIPYLVTHLGYHRGAGIDAGQERVIAAINRALVDAGEDDVMLLLENTAGEKNSVGTTVADLSLIMEGIDARERIGICFDTCHAFAAGYDLRTAEGVDAVFGELDDLIGLEHLRVIHLNDSKGDLGGGLDRHEHIGLGAIGEEGFWHILRHPAVRSLPLICETPVDERRDDAGNIAKVRELAGAQDHRTTDFA